MAYFSVDILTPAKVLVKDMPADSLTIPTVRGEINVLPEHTHLITELETGVLTLEHNGVKEHFSVTSGICKILKNRVTILSKTSEFAKDVNRERAEKSFRESTEKLNSGASLSDEEFQALCKKIERAKVRIRLSNLKS